MDLLDVPIAFDVEDGIDFFDLDTAADEAEDHLAAVALADAFHDTVHGLVELLLRKRLDQIMGSPDGKSFDGKFFARRQEDDFSPALLLSHLCGNVRPQQAGHTDIQQDDVEIPLFSKESTKSMALLQVKTSIGSFLSRKYCWTAFWMMSNCSCKSSQIAIRTIVTPPFNKQVFYKFIISPDSSQAVRCVTKWRIFDA